MSVHFYEVFRRLKVREGKMVGVTGWGKEDGEFVLSGDRVSVWEDGKVLGMDGGDSTMSVLNNTQCTLKNG